MKIAFYHYFWPHLLKDREEDFKNKISEYLVIHNLIESLEKKGYIITKYSKAPPTPYYPNKNIIIFRQGLILFIDLIKFFLNPPEFLGLVSKSIYNSKSLVPIIRFICRIRKIKLLIFMGHDESETSMNILKDVKPYKYQEDVFWNNPDEYRKRKLINNSYRPKSKNEYIVVPSKIIKSNCIMEGWSKKNIITLPHGTNTDFFIPANDKPANDIVRILFAGNGATRKGLPYILRAYELLQKHYNLELTILSHNIKNINISNVKILEDISDQELRKLYQTHDIFVLPSLLDGWGLTVSEAMSCGLPVIVSKLTGISDILKNGENAFIVDAKNSNKIYETLETLINNYQLRSNIGKKARITIMEYQWDHISKKFIEIFKNM